jgi:hypothetical protein
MNELHYAYFTDDEIQYITGCIDDILRIYSFMNWEEPPEREELESHICDSILEMRSDESLSYIVRWRVKVENDMFSDHDQEISIVL